MYRTAPAFIFQRLKNRPKKVKVGQHLDIKLLLASISLTFAACFNPVVYLPYRLVCLPGKKGF